MLFLYLIPLVSAQWIQCSRGGTTGYRMLTSSKTHKWDVMCGDSEAWLIPLIQGQLVTEVSRRDFFHSKNASKKKRGRPIIPKACDSYPELRCILLKKEDRKFYMRYVECEDKLKTVPDRVTCDEIPKWFPTKKDKKTGEPVPIINLIKLPKTLVMELEDFPVIKSVFKPLKRRSGEKNKAYALRCRTEYNIRKREMEWFGFDIIPTPEEVTEIKKDCTIKRVRNIVEEPFTWYKKPVKREPVVVRPRIRVDAEEPWVSKRIKKDVEKPDGSDSRDTSSGESTPKSVTTPRQQLKPVSRKILRKPTPAPVYNKLTPVVTTRRTKPSPKPARHHKRTDSTYLYDVISRIKREEKKHSRDMAYLDLGKYEHVAFPTAKRVKGKVGPMNWTHPSTVNNLANHRKFLEKRYGYAY